VLLNRVRKSLIEAGYTTDKVDENLKGIQMPEELCGEYMDIIKDEVDYRSECFGDDYQKGRDIHDRLDSFKKN
jgi:hypothetical protein